MNIIQNIVIDKAREEPDLCLDTLQTEFAETNQTPQTYPCGICGESHMSTECSIINIKQHVKDTPVLSKARLSLPSNLEVVTMAEGTCTVRALQNFDEGTKFGPFQAKKIFTLDPKINYPLKVFKNDEYFKEYYLDNSCENECNWMLFVEPASILEEQNLMSYEDNSEIYFISIREINVGEYLKVWYSPYSAKMMNKDALPSSQIEIPDTYEQLPDNKIININDLIKKQQKIRNRKKWICKYCSLQFVELTEFALHMLQHYSTQLRKVCEYCSQTFQTRMKLKKHLFFVHNDEIYAQKIHTDIQPPNSTFTIEQKKSEDAMVGGPLLNNADMLVQDMEMSNYELDSPNNMTLDPDNLTADNLLSVNENFNFHIAESDEKFVCDICLKHFSRLKFLINHLQLHTGKFTCNICCTVFARKENLQGHSCNKPTLKCPHCDQMFGLKKFLTRHVAYKHRNEFTCTDVCKKVFSSARTLNEHKCQPEKVLLTCNLCQKVFSKNRNLARHLKTHKTNVENENKVIYLCDTCPKQYDTKKGINQHMETHKEKQYSCLICQKKFIRRSTFQEHMELHKDILPFACTLCDQKFILRKYLTLHMRVHNDTGNFKCMQCSKTFRQRSNLQTHFSRRHEKKCLDCNQLFDSAEKLKQHSVLHYEKCYECPCCKHIVKLKSSLSRHLKKKHPDEVVNIHDIKELNQANASDNLENVDNNNINMDSDFDKNDIADLFDLKDKDDSNTTTTMQDIEQNLDYIVNNFDANNLIHEANLLNPDNLLNDTNINHDTGLIMGLGDDNSLINDATRLIDDDFADITGGDKNIDEHVLDFNSLEMEFEKNFNMTPEVDLHNREVCLSMPELSDIDQNITLGENAYILENGNIIEPIEQGKVVLYILDKDGNKTT